MSAVLKGVPLVDFGAGADQTSRQLATACCDWGFFQVANHGIDLTLAEQALQASAAFFRQDPGEKQALSRSQHSPWGYYDRELTKNLRDRKEIFDFSPAAAAPWPVSPPDFRATVENWTLACHHLALTLVRLLCLGLGVPESHLEKHFSPDHSSFTRLNHYPVEDPLGASGAPEPGPLGISHHSDAGALTVLLQDDIPGLQVSHGERWCDVSPVKNTLTINIGDMMQVWSNDRYRAPLHRVKASEGQNRFSIAYFLNPSYSTIVSPLGSTISAGNPPRYRPISWREFRGLRAQGDYGDYGEEVQISHYQI